MVLHAKFQAAASLWENLMFQTERRNYPIQTKRSTIYYNRVLMSDKSVLTIITDQPFSFGEAQVLGARIESVEGIAFRPTITNNEPIVPRPDNG